MPPKKGPKTYWSVLGSPLSKDLPVYHLLSIDPGYKNLGMYLERRSKHYVRGLKTELISHLISETVVENVLVEFHEIVSKWHKKYPFDAVVVEEQLKVSKLPRIISHAMLGVFSVVCPGVPIYYVSPHLKGKLIGNAATLERRFPEIDITYKAVKKKVTRTEVGPRGGKKKIRHTVEKDVIDIKVVTVDVALVLLSQRGDNKTIRTIQKARREHKADDRSDVIVQLQAFCEEQDIFPFPAYKYGGEI